MQPPEPLDEWQSDPFELTDRCGKLFARGVSDNKGDLIARLAALRVVQELQGGLPCNVKFLIEGGEEIGSPNLASCMTRYRDLFQADACIWECGEKDNQERLRMVAGVKGMAYFDLWCEGADVDIHSMTGSYVDNPAWRLVHALSSMKNAENEIVVEGFYDGVIPPAPKQLQSAQSNPFDPAAVKSQYGLKRPLITEAKGQDPRWAMYFAPTMTICGLESGYTGKGNKAVLPRRAAAKLDCRLVPGQDPLHIRECLRTHLDLHGFDDVQIELLISQKAYHSDLEHPFVDLVMQTAKDVYGGEVILAPNTPGTGPMHEIGHGLQVPILSTGVGWYDSRYHAPNESIRLRDFEQGIVHIAYLLCKFGELAF